MMVSFVKNPLQNKR